MTIMFGYSILPKAAALLLLSAAASAAPKIPAKRELSFDYNNDKVLGVNLGGWFVLEPWITPSIFSDWAESETVVDEYTYTATLGKDEATSRLTDHWNTWITQDDFNQIAAAGMNHVRIPVGYWAVAPLDGDPYVQGQLPILDTAIDWARSAGLKVMIDLHGAPGSQNGFDNSGRRGDIDWQQGSTVQETLNAIRGLAERYAQYTDVVTSIQLLNEPMGPKLDLSGIKQFYYDGWGTVRDSNADTMVCIHDAFEDFVGYWNGFMNQASGINHVMLDTHQYQVFTTGQLELTLDQHVAAACGLGPALANTDKWTVVGEWTAGLTDCAKWLNGLGTGARYDGSFAGSSALGSCDGKSVGTVAALPADYKKQMRQFVEAQLDAYERHTGWFFWTWKTESAPEWHMNDLLAEGVFPSPLDSRLYPGQCGY